MIQKVVRHDEVVDEVAARIAEAVRPWRIVLFGSRARGDSREDSDYDLLIEIDSSATPRIEIERQIRELFLGRAFRVDVKLRGPGEIERRRDDPGALEWDGARGGGWPRGGGGGLSPSGFRAAGSGRRLRAPVPVRSRNSLPGRAGSR